MTTRSQGFALMVTALGILVLPGLMVNNMTANGLVTPPQTSCPSGEILSQGSCFTCSSSTNSCVLAALVGCQLSPQNCNLNGSAIAFLNPCSPFTGILTLNFASFVSSFFTSCGTSTTQSAPISVIAQNINATTLTYKISGCTNIAVTDYGGSISWLLGCSTVSPTIKLTNGTALQGWFGYKVLVSINNVSGGCSSSGWNGVIGNLSTSTTPTSAVVCITQYIVPSGCTLSSCITSVLMVGDGKIWGDSSYSISKTPVGNQTVTPRQPIKVVNMTGLVAVAQYIHLQGGSGLNSQPLQNGVPGTGLGGFNVSNLLSFLLSLIGAAFVFFLSTGVGGSLSGLTFGMSLRSNPQGTKLAQTLGIGLVIWFPLYTEFNSWFAFMPLGLTAVVATALIACFFLGAYSLSQSGTAAAQ